MYIFSKFMGLILILIFPLVASGGQNQQAGNMKDLTSVEAGLLIKLDTGMPGNCAGSPYDYMLVREENKTLISVTLALWITEKKGVTVFTSGIPGGSGYGVYCVVNQVRPQ